MLSHKFGSKKDAFAKNKNKKNLDLLRYIQKNAAMYMQDQVSGIVTTTTLLDAMKICTKTQVCEAKPLLKQRNSSVSIE